MKHSTILLFLYILITTNVYSSNPQTNSHSIFKAEPLKFGEIKPQGWILKQMQADMEHGIAGHFPEINNNTEKQRFVLHNAKPDNVPHLADDDHQRGWWSGEHEAYYADGFFRNAWLIGDEKQKQEAIARLEAVLKAQSADGYIGIYSEENRFPKMGPDGELWTQSRMFQALLAYYEATGRKDILNAVEKAVKLTIKHYYKQPYFSRIGSKDGGVSHGVGFFDTLEWLYRITGDKTYKQTFLWLYSDYSKGDTRDLDMILSNVVDKDKPWIAHTPHTAEGLAAPQIASAYQNEKNDSFVLASRNVWYKLAKYSNPSGGLVGDESILNRPGTFDLTAEYCSMTETVGSLNRIAVYRGPFEGSGRTELIAFNAAQGARLHPAATSVSYLSKDNRAIIKKTTHGGRELFSPCHHAAACCALNSTRLMPYFVEGMWMKNTRENILMARLYGPCEITTQMGKKQVQIKEQTHYPFSDGVRFEINTQSPTKFTLQLYVPKYNKQITYRVPKGMVVSWAADSSYLNVEGVWKKGDQVLLDLNFSVRKIEDISGKMALAYGPLLFSLPIESESKTVRTFSEGKFVESEYYPTKELSGKLFLKNINAFKSIYIPKGNYDSPWECPPIGLSGYLTNGSGEQVNVILQPLGSTILRQTGFEP